MIPASFAHWRWMVATAYWLLTYFWWLATDLIKAQVVVDCGQEVSNKFRESLHNNRRRPSISSP